MLANDKQDTHQKALSINLDTSLFGSFAEIGAGQEVARWFFRVGGASGTVAKTISAYDKSVSDHLYGVGTRYVSKARIMSMLDKEWEQLLEQLLPSRSADTRFFSFVDTLSARNFAGTNDCHGWVGLRFQTEPGSAPNDVILHINLRDSSNIAQQEAVGILGVNLIYATQHVVGSARQFLSSVFEDLGLARIEIDSVELSGSVFASWHRSELHACLVVDGCAEAVVFPADREQLPPNELLYKRSVVLAPGKVDSQSPALTSVIRDTLAQLPEDEISGTKGGLGLYCLSTINERAERDITSIREIVERVGSLQRSGYGVILFRARELYKMSAYVNRHTKSRIHFAIGLSVLMRVFEDRYNDLPGRLLEGIARLFTQNVRISVYPMTAKDAQRRMTPKQSIEWEWEEINGVISAADIHLSGPLDSLYQYLLRSELLLPGKLTGNESSPAPQSSTQAQSTGG
jgi:hypothetical protein